MQKTPPHADRWKRESIPFLTYTSSEWSVQRGTDPVAAYPHVRVSNLPQFSDHIYIWMCSADADGDGLLTEVASYEGHVLLVMQ